MLKPKEGFYQRWSAFYRSKWVFSQHDIDFLQILPRETVVSERVAVEMVTIREQLTTRSI